MSRSSTRAQDSSNIVPLPSHNGDTAGQYKEYIAENDVEQSALQTPTEHRSKRKENLFMVLITLTQLVQLIPFGAGINSGLSIGKSLGATQAQSVWIAASYPLTQGSFVLIGKLNP